MIKYMYIGCITVLICPLLFSCVLFVQLLKSLDVETYSDECTLLISYIVSTEQHNNGNMKQPPYQAQNINMEDALYWRVLVETKQVTTYKQQQASK
jgi:hypothetical protein